MISTASFVLLCDGHSGGGVGGLVGGGGFGFIGEK